MLWLYFCSSVLLEIFIQVDDSNINRN